jgi:hypothetical protein
VKKISFAMLVFVGTAVFGIPRVVAQDTASQSASAAGSGVESFSDQQMALLRKDIRSIKKQLIAANLTLTDAEATKFWPVFEQYSAEFAKINDTRTALIKEYADAYGSLTDQQAGQKGRYLLSTRPTHQHDDRPATYVAASTRAKSGLIC